VILSLQLPGSSAPATRITADEENHVQTVDVLAFDAAGAYLYTAAADNVAIADEQPAGNVSAIRTFRVRLRPTEGAEKVDLWVIANARTVLGGITGSPQKEALAATLLAAETFAGSACYGVTQTNGFCPIPMWGELTSVTISPVNGLGTNNRVNLTRMVAKIDVAVATDAQSQFTLSSVRFYNRNAVGRIVPIVDNGSWTADPVTDSPYATAPSLPDSPGKQEGIPLSYENMTTTDISITNTIYAFEAESEADDNGSTEVDWGWGDEGEVDDNAAPSTYLNDPCLVIGGSYGGGAETFYRLDFVVGGTHLDILRNYRYAVSIESVSGPGSPDPDDALVSRPVNMTANVIAWNESIINEVDMGDNYRFSVSRDSITFYQNGDAETIDVFTDHPDGWAVKSLPTWLEVVSPLPAEGLPDETTRLVLRATPLANNDPARPETGFYITAGRLEKYIKVDQRHYPLKFVSTNTTADIPRTGGDPAKNINGVPLTLEFTGSYNGEFQVHTYNANGTKFTSSSNNKSAHPVNIGVNDSWNTRNITYSFSVPGLPEQPIPTNAAWNRQLGYTIWGSGDPTISYEGGDYVVTVGGDFPSDTQLYAVVLATNTEVASSTPVVEGTATLSIAENSGDIREIAIFATSVTAGLNDSPLFTLSQARGPITEFTYNNNTYALFEIYAGVAATGQLITMDHQTLPGNNWGDWGRINYSLFTTLQTQIVSNIHILTALNTRKPIKYLDDGLVAGDIFILDNAGGRMGATSDNQVWRRSITFDSYPVTFGTIHIQRSSDGENYTATYSVDHDVTQYTTMSTEYGRRVKIFYLVRKL
jgi:hypothetical protein